MRAVLILLASTGCSQIFGLDVPQRVDARTEVIVDARVDGSVPPSDALVTVMFRQGVNGYTGAIDTYIDAGAPDASREGDTVVRIRDSQRWGLLQFGGVFPAVPQTATIVSATLELTMQGVNCTGGIGDVTTSWSATVTYNTFGATAGVQPLDDFSPTTLAIPTMPGVQTLDVLESVKRWQTTSNNGWIFVAGAGGGGGDCTFRSSDDSFQNMHPRLTVSYMP